MNLYIGLMSGTSMDGIDAALLDVTTNKLIVGITRPYSSRAREWLKKAQDQPWVELGFISQLNTIIGQEFAQAVLQLLDSAQVSSQDVTAVGSHGQTICHDASAQIPYTVQVGCAHTIAQMTKIQVAADFRTRDLVVGGQGAPFAPIYHQALFNDYGWPLALLNIGGIANVTYLTGRDSAVGYDLGPGNCLMDLWVQKKLGKPYDMNGDWANAGNIITPLLSSMRKDHFFALPFPKSIGKEYFSQQWLQNYLSHNAQDDADVQATLLALTVSIIADEIVRSKLKLNKVLICGGGAHNNALISSLEAALPHLSIESTANSGINPDFIEAMMFAWLAEKTINKIPLNLNKITGAKIPAILGAIYPISP